ncbi:MAG: archease [Spirochaetota bacterium]
MPYQYIDSIAIADVAFEAQGATIEELFRACWEAAVNVMVSDLRAIKGKVRRNIRLRESNIELLLFNFLQEMIFLKDAEQLLLLIDTITIYTENGQETLQAEAKGERIDPLKHELIVDIKAVTLHHFMVKRSSDGWKATVVLDV